MAILYIRDSQGAPIGQYDSSITDPNNPMSYQYQLKQAQAAYGKFGVQTDNFTSDNPNNLPQLPNGMANPSANQIPVGQIPGILGIPPSGTNPTPFPDQPPLTGGPVTLPPGPLSTPDTPVNQSTVPNTDISPYIPATSTQQQDIIKNAIAQSQGVGQQNVQSLQDILNPYVTSQVKNWTDPNSPDYQATMGNLNNFGRADNNTFGQSLASRLAPLIAQNQMSLGTNALIPSFNTQQGLVSSGAGTQSNLGLASLQRFIDQQNFDKQAALANQLADKGQPSNFQQGVGAGSSLLSGVGNFMQGLPGAKIVADATSYVCLELIKRNLLSESDMDDFHFHIVPAVMKKGRAFWKYAMDGKKLVDAVNLDRDKASIIWKEIKPLLFDEVMKEPNACKAVDRYASACHILCNLSDRSLWDSRIERTGILDSLVFLPRLAFYKPFQKVFFKFLKVKMAFVYDKPPLEV